jgi:ATP-dependent RNA helicase RhlE
MSFSNLNLIAPIQQAVQEAGYEQPTPIQRQAIPQLLAGRDLIGCAQTGTGKTAAFALPILQMLAAERPETKGARPIRALILTPTRELAIQIDESLAVYGRNLKLRHAVIFGGVSQNPQVEELQSGVDILVATPGRLLDLMQQKVVQLRDIRMFVLDEADRMLDMGFLPDVRRVIAQLPKERQTLLFSATMPDEIAKLAASLLRQPIRVEVTPASSTVDAIQQAVYFVDKPNKRHLLIYLLRNESIDSALVFTRTKYGADKLTRQLVKAGIPAQAIHGNKSQSARQRALGNFKAHQTRVLVATDIAARGIDVEELSHVINFELLNVPETYVHRIGRTGRAGLSGVALSLCDQDERAYLKDIERLIGKSIPVVADHPFPLGTQAE